MSDCYNHDFLLQWLTSDCSNFYYWLQLSLLLTAGTVTSDCSECYNCSDYYIWTAIQSLLFTAVIITSDCSDVMSDCINPYFWLQWRYIWLQQALLLWPLCLTAETLLLAAMIITYDFNDHVFWLQWPVYRFFYSHHYSWLQWFLLLTSVIITCVCSDHNSWLQQSLHLSAVIITPGCTNPSATEF